jgi:hypothetical protein
MMGPARVSAMLASGHGEPLAPGDGGNGGDRPPGTGLVSALGATDAYRSFYHQPVGCGNRAPSGRRYKYGGDSRPTEAGEEP